VPLPPLQALDQWEEAEEKAALALAKQQTKARKGQAVGRKAKPAAKKKAAKKMLDSDEDGDDSDDDMDDDDDWDEAPKKKAPAPKAAKPAAAAAAAKAPLYPTKAAVAAPKWVALHTNALTLMQRCQPLTSDLQGCRLPMP
jgi:hypothetical protein